MAKFYQRYLVQPAEKTVLYGYKGQNYTVNGQTYTAATNVQQIGNFQCYPACTGIASVCCQYSIDLGLEIAPIVSDTIFEPSYYANPFDLLGSRFPAYTDHGMFLEYASNKNSLNQWTFKNHEMGLGWGYNVGAAAAWQCGPVPNVNCSVNRCVCASFYGCYPMYYDGPACFKINQSNTPSCLTGCVCNGSCMFYNDDLKTKTCAHGTYSGFTNGFITNSGVCCGLSCWGCYSYNVPCYNYLPTKDVDGNVIRFIPYSAHMARLNPSSCCYQSQMGIGCGYEPTSGDTCVTYITYCGAGTSCRCCSYMCCSLQTYNCCTPSAIATCPGYSDAKLFGVEKYDGGCNCCQTGSQSGTVCQTNMNFGAYPLYGDMYGTADLGVRVFLTKNSSYLFYLHHNATNGGIQGSDVSTSTLPRLTVKQVNISGNSTTTVATIRKGISGLVIPSQGDQDDSSGYSFYIISFNGYETGVQTISIYKPSITLSTGSFTQGSAYTLTMTAQEQADIYANLGHNNTSVGPWDNATNQANFRRATTNRIWYSVDTNGNKRLHLGIYNTNSQEVVTAGNGFTDAGNRGKMFKIYSWSINDGATSATYLGATNMAPYTPRYFCPLDANWQVLYVGSSTGNDNIFVLNESTGLYTYQNTMPYTAARLFKDKDGRWATQVVDYAINSAGRIGNYIDIITATVGQTLSITADATTFVYSGTTINSTIKVNVYNYLGQRVAANVSLSIVGPTSNPGITFGDGSYSTTVATSSSADTSVAIKIISSASAKIIGVVSA